MSSFVNLSQYFALFVSIRFTVQVKSLSVVERKFMSYSEIYHPSVRGWGLEGGAKRRITFQSYCSSAVFMSITLETWR